MMMMVDDDPDDMMRIVDDDLNDSSPSEKDTNVIGNKHNAISNMFTVHY